MDNGSEFGAGVLTYTRDNGMHLPQSHTCGSSMAAWRGGGHGQVRTGIRHASFAETIVDGAAQVKSALYMAAMAKHRRPGRTGYSPRAFIYGVYERVVAIGFDHYLEQPKRRGAYP